MQVPMTTQTVISLKLEPPKKATLASKLRVRGGSAKFVTITLLAWPSVFGCSNRSENCSYTLTCGHAGAGGSDAGAGGKTSGSSNGNTGVGGLGGAGGTNAGGIASACNPTCSGTKPVCNESAKTCVECLADDNCSGSKPACNAATNTCVPCMKDSHCSGSTPVCDTAQYVCVQCLSDTNCSGVKPACKTASASDAGTGMNICVQCTTDAHCSVSKPLCDDSKNTCVECLTNNDCPQANASLCLTGTCSPCTADADCAHIPSKTVCDTTKSSTNAADAGTGSDAGASTNTCVQCTGTDFATCGQSNGAPLVCDSLSNSCSTKTQGSAGLCQTCVSDAQCAASELCVNEQFNGQSVGYFCFYKQGATGAPANCLLNGRPYAKTITGATSIDGQTADICSLRVTTCPALNEFSQKDCTSSTSTANDQLCGFAPGADSKCVAVTSTQYRCTTVCASNDNCKFSCNTGTSPNICTFQ